MRKIELLVSGKEDEKLQAEKTKETVERIERRSADYLSSLKELISDEKDIIREQEELLAHSPQDFSFAVVDTALMEIKMLEERKAAIEAYKKELFAETK